MGFTTGFTGGVTLTLGIAYLTLHAHQRNREHQAAVLRQQTYLLASAVDPLPPVLPPTRAELAAAARANLAEAAKDRWNAEVEAAVRWAQTKDWAEVREGVETAVARLWARGIGSGGGGGGGGGGDNNAPEEAGRAVREKSEGVAAAAKEAFADAKAKSAELVGKADEKAEGAKDTVIGAIGKGIAGFFGKAESAVVKGAEGVDKTAASPVEKALRQRYEQRSDGLNKSADEVLAARYAPVEKQDKSKLKAL